MPCAQEAGRSLRSTDGAARTLEKPTNEGRTNTFQEEEVSRPSQAFHRSGKGLLVVIETTLTLSPPVTQEIRICPNGHNAISLGAAHGDGSRCNRIVADNILMEGGGSLGHRRCAGLLSIYKYG